MSNDRIGLVILRHAESLEDIDNTAYEKIADEDMPLSEKGRWQACMAGKAIVQEFRDRQNLRFVLSPSKRVLETAKIIISELPRGTKWALSTERLIVKQNWGNVTVANRKAIEMERYRVGVLRYRFPGGESGSEMLSRFKTFAENLRQSLASAKVEDLVVIITHGFEMRVILKSLLLWSEEFFESLAHPRNCELKRISFREPRTLTLLNEMRRHDPATNPNFVQRQKT